MPLQNVSHVLLVLSGKGGVGKSSVTLQLALALTVQGYNVGILDIDLTGPSIPRLVGKEDAKIKQAPGGWLPVEVYPRVEVSPDDGIATNGRAHDGGQQTDTTKSSLDVETTATQSPPPPPRRLPRGSLHALSLAFLLPSRSSAVIWRGPKKTAMIRQFISDALWPPNTDFLLVDTPPGTSDEHIAIAEELHKIRAEFTAVHTASSVSGGADSRMKSLSSPPADPLMGAVVVTTPQAISTSDVRKELNFCRKTSIPVVGVIENMAGYVCPCCGEVSNIFSKDGGKIMAQEAGVKFLGCVPVDTAFGSMVEGVVVNAENQNENENDSQRKTTDTDTEATSASAPNGDGDEKIVSFEENTNKGSSRVLVDRWQDQCASLSTIFANFVKTILDG